MVSAPASFSLDELKAIASQSQITMHTCMQGWTGIAKWTGIRVRDLLEQVGQVDPLRLRCETSHGYKMIKWVRSVTVIRHYSEVGDGMGGTREDSGYQDVNARI